MAKLANAEISKIFAARLTRSIRVSGIKWQNAKNAGRQSSPCLLVQYDEERKKKQVIALFLQGKSVKDLAIYTDFTEDKIRKIVKPYRVTKTQLMKEYILKNSKLSNTEIATFFYVRSCEIARLRTALKALGHKV